MHIVIFLLQTKKNDLLRVGLHELGKEGLPVAHVTGVVVVLHDTGHDAVPLGLDTLLVQGEEGNEPGHLRKTWFEIAKLENIFTIGQIL